MKALIGKLVSGTTGLIKRVTRLYHPQTLREKRYLYGLSRQGETQTQFYARADNLRDWLAVVEKRLVSLRQIIRELEATQEPISSPMVLNGSGLGIFASYSLVMASYITHANAAVIDLRNLLSQG